MSMIFAASDFIQALQSIDRYLHSTRDILCYELQDIAKQLQLRAAAAQRCLLDNVGDFLTSLLDLVANLAKNFVEGDRIVRYIEKRIAQSDSQEELSDRSILNYLDNNRETLR